MLKKNPIKLKQYKTNKQYHIKKYIMYNIITCLVSSVILTGGCFKTSGDDGFNILLKFSIILQK